MKTLKRINKQFKTIYKNVARENNIKLDDRLLTHVIAVKELALKILNEFKINNEILIEKVRFIALYHDIGRLMAKPFGKYPMLLHGILSKYIMKNYLKECKYKNELLHGLASHVGSGFKKEEIKAMVKVPDFIKINSDLIPKTLSQRLVCYSDNLIQYNQEVPFHFALAEVRNKYGLKAAKRFLKLHNEVFNSLIHYKKSHSVKIK